MAVVKVSLFDYNDIVPFSLVYNRDDLVLYQDHLSQNIILNNVNIKAKVTTDVSIGFEILKRIGLLLELVCYIM